MTVALSRTLMLDRLEETIVAISSAPGFGPVGIVRLGGPGAVTIADRIVVLDASASLADRPGSTRVSCEVRIDVELTLPAEVYLFRAPRSYTRQDLVEIHTVGSPAVLEMVRRLALQLGAVAAEPGEFTARAFLNGAMDLSSAEAVAGVIRAETDTQLRAARRMMDGSLAERIAELRNELAELVGLVEADIDFAEEPIEFVTPDELKQRLGGVTERLRSLLESSVSIERLDVLPHILLLGRPNVGKSSLMNRLSGTPRAICAAVAGTTRDVLSAPFALGRGEAILLDTAGVNEKGDRIHSEPSGDATTQDEIIIEAQARAIAAAERVDLICLVVDLSEDDDEHLFETVRSLDVGALVVAANKCDLVEPDKLNDRLQQLRSGGAGPVCAVSALEDTGIESLRGLLADALGSAVTTTTGESVLISERQGTAIGSAVESLQRAIALSEDAKETIDCADVLAFELREALESLGTVTGEVTTEDLLGRIFANFCIGK